MFQCHGLQVLGRVGEATIFEAAQRAPVVVGHRAIALHRPGLAGDGRLAQALEGLRVQPVLKQVSLELAQHLIGLWQVGAFDIGIQAEEADAAQ